MVIKIYHREFVHNYSQTILCNFLEFYLFAYFLQFHYKSSKYLENILADQSVIVQDNQPISLSEKFWSFFYNCCKEFIIYQLFYKTPQFARLQRICVPQYPKYNLCCLLLILLNRHNHLQLQKARNYITHFNLKQMLLIFPSVRHL